MLVFGVKESCNRRDRIDRDSISGMTIGNVICLLTWNLGYPSLFLLVLHFFARVTYIHQVLMQISYHVLVYLQKVIGLS